MERRSTQALPKVLYIQALSYVHFYSKIKYLHIKWVSLHWQPTVPANVNFARIFTSTEKLPPGWVSYSIPFQSAYCLVSLRCYLLSYIISQHPKTKGSFLLKCHFLINLSTLMYFVIENPESISLKYFVYHVWCFTQQMSVKLVSYFAQGSLLDML